MEVKELVTVSHKQVHAELEQEALFLHKNHNIEAFKEKADFLNTIGFTESIATRLYDGVAKSHSVIKGYEQKYHGQYKFIILPQLERLCEKYNLFVRECQMFQGDIPEKNIADIMRFKVHIDDLNVNIDARIHLLEYVRRKERPSLNSPHWNSFNFNSQDVLKISLQDLAEHNMLNHMLSIAAVEDLFNPQAFVKSRKRIIGKRPELVAKSQVDTDPIVLLETMHGFLIITAWGDEANDELVVNHKLN